MTGDFGQDKGIEELLARQEQHRQILKMPLMPHRRLEIVEGLFFEGRIDEEDAHAILERNPILSAEMEEIALACKETLRGLGIPLADYAIYHHARHDPHDLSVGSASMQPHHNAIEIGTQGGFWFPMIIAHEYGHAFQVENGKLRWQMRRASDPRMVLDHAPRLTEGWANYVALQYCRARDEEIGRTLYERSLVGAIECVALRDALEGEECPQYEGFMLYKDLPLDRAMEAALTCGSDHELSAFLGKP